MSQDDKDLSKNARPFGREFDPDGDDGTLDIPNAPPGGGAGQSAEQQRIAELEAQVNDLRDQALRALAEAENVRKRMQREMEDSVKFASTKFARDMLSVADNLGRALQALPADRDQLDPTVKSVIEGVEATERELQAIFERNGVKRIDPVGQAFNPEFHQAVMEVPTSEHAPGTVAMVMMPGYLLKDRLLRPAMVGVAKAG